MGNINAQACKKILITFDHRFDLGQILAQRRLHGQALLNIAASVQDCGMCARKTCAYSRSRHLCIAPGKKHHHLAGIGNLRNDAGLQRV